MRVKDDRFRVNYRVPMCFFDYLTRGCGRNDLDKTQEVQKQAAKRGLEPSGATRACAWRVTTSENFGSGDLEDSSLRRKYVEMYQRNDQIQAEKIRPRKTE